MGIVSIVGAFYYMVAVSFALLWEQELETRSEDGGWQAVVQIGFPPQEFHLSLSTLIKDAWLFTDDCNSHCKCRESQYRGFNCDNSYSCKFSKKILKENLIYWNIDANFSIDRLSIGNARKELPFHIVNSVHTCFLAIRGDGMIGLGPNSTFLNAFFPSKQKIIGIDKMRSKEGYKLIVSDNNLDQRDGHICSVYPDKNKRFLLEQFYSNNAKADHDLYMRFAIIDYAEPYITFPSTFFETIRKIIIPQCAYVSANSSLICPCDEEDEESFPTFALHIASTRFEFTLADLEIKNWIHLRKKYCLVAIGTWNDGASKLSNTDGGAIILGKPFIAKYPTYYLFMGDNKGKIVIYNGIPITGSVTFLRISMIVLPLFFMTLVGVLYPKKRDRIEAKELLQEHEQSKRIHMAWKELVLAYQSIQRKSNIPRKKDDPSMQVQPNDSFFLT